MVPNLLWPTLNLSPLCGPSRASRTKFANSLTTSCLPLKLGRLPKAIPSASCTSSKPEIDLPPDMDVYNSKGLRKREGKLRPLDLRRRAQTGTASLFFPLPPNHGPTRPDRLGCCRQLRRLPERCDKKARVHAPGQRRRPRSPYRNLEFPNRPRFPRLSRDRRTRCPRRQRNFALLPDTDFTAPDGIRHSAWTLRDPAKIETVRSAFARIPFLYIADGQTIAHAAAGRVLSDTERRKAKADIFSSVIFPHNQMRIPSLLQSRIERILNGLTSAQLLTKRSKQFSPSRRTVSPQPTSKHRTSVFISGRQMAHLEIPSRNDQIERRHRPA